MKTKVLIVLFMISINGFCQSTRIYCKPEIKYCLSNLNKLNKWLIYDNEENKIPKYVFQLNSIGLDNTIRSLKMMTENKGQCSSCKSKLKYCSNNLLEMRELLIKDFEMKEISEEIFQEYLLVFDNTISSLEMMIENKGQCDTTAKAIKFQHDIDY